LLRGHPVARVRRSSGGKEGHWMRCYALRSKFQYVECQSQNDESQKLFSTKKDLPTSFTVKIFARGAFIIYLFSRCIAPGTENCKL
jgi:hypothetical protein